MDKSVSGDKSNSKRDAIIPVQPLTTPFRKESILLDAMRRDRGGQSLLGLLLLASILVPLLNLVVPESSILYLSTYCTC